MIFKLESISFNDNETIPSKYTCDEKNISPSLEWKNFPTGTNSFAIIVDSIAAYGSAWNHWIIYNIPVEINKLEEGIAALPKPAKLGVNSWKTKKY